MLALSLGAESARRVLPLPATAKEFLMSIPLILEKVSFLKGVLDPNWVDGGPGQPGPVYRSAIADYVVAGLVRAISQKLTNQEVGARLLVVGKDLATESSRGMTAGYDEGDDICPPWYWNRPIPHHLGVGPESALDPVPVPWLQHLGPAMNDVLLANALRQLASLTTSAKASNALREAGETIMKGASSRLYDEYCGTSVKPRIPTPKSRPAAA